LAALRYNRKSVGATWFRQRLQSRTGHTEDWLPRKYSRKRLIANVKTHASAANDSSFALAA
jgi:ribosomal protein L29